MLAYPANADVKGSLPRFRPQLPVTGASDMNPANFSNVGGGMPGGAKPHGQMQVPQKNENVQMIMNHVAQALQAQGPFTGWRAEVPVQERVMKVCQM